tara:strand:+ start:631 stop:1026 length:396 start_codon:yes stop_codon:yes gene_type:complete
VGSGGTTTVTRNGALEVLSAAAAASLPAAAGAVSSAAAIETSESAAAAAAAGGGSVSSIGTGSSGSSGVALCCGTPLSSGRGDGDRMAAGAGLSTGEKTLPMGTAVKPRRAPARSLLRSTASRMQPKHRLY